MLRHHVRGFAVFVLTLALSDGALSVLHGVDPAPPRAAELAVLVIGGLLATVIRYVAMKTWVFARRGAGRERSGGQATRAGSASARGR